MQAAWGTPTIRTISTALPDNRGLVFEQAVMPDGQWLVCADQPNDFLNNTTRSSFAVLYNAASGQMITMHQLLHIQSQILGAAADDHWVV